MMATTQPPVNPSQRAIILASQSRQRRKLMAALPLNFQVVPAHIDEQAIRDPDLEQRAAAIATAKAEAVSQQHPDAIVIAADTFNLVNDTVLEKPADKQEARHMLEQLSGQEVLTYTGFCYLDPVNDIARSQTVIPRSRFRQLSAAEIEQYVTTQLVTEWAAAYSPAYHQGMALIEEVHGSLTAFAHGLPLELVVEGLRESGVGIGDPDIIGLR